MREEGFLKSLKAQKAATLKEKVSKMDSVKIKSFMLSKVTRKRKYRQTPEWEKRIVTKIAKSITIQ